MKRNSVPHNTVGTKFATT